MFDCGGKRETPTTLEDTLNKYEIMSNMQQNDLDEIYAKYDLLCFQVIETKIKSVIILHSNRELSIWMCFVPECSETKFT